MKTSATTLISVFLLIAGASFAQEAERAQPLEKTEKKTKAVYKKYTEFDFAGETVQGKSRTPELFYIFQRKRSGGHEVVNLPEDFLFHQEETVLELKEALK